MTNKSIIPESQATIGTIFEAAGANMIRRCSTSRTRRPTKAKLQARQFTIIRDSDDQSNEFGALRSFSNLTHHEILTNSYGEKRYSMDGFDQGAVGHDIMDLLHTISQIPPSNTAATVDKALDMNKLGKHHEALMSHPPSITCIPEIISKEGWQSQDLEWKMPSRLRDETAKLLAEDSISSCDSSLSDVTSLFSEDDLPLAVEPSISPIEAREPVKGFALLPMLQRREHPNENKSGKLAGFFRMSAPRLRSKSKLMRLESGRL